MASYYGVLWPEFWTGRTGRDIRKAGGANAQVLALYLCSNRHANMLGLYKVSLEDIAHETGLKPKAILAAFAVLEAEFARYDAASEYVWVLSMARFRLSLKPGETLQAGDRKVIAIGKLYHGIDDNAFLGAFFDAYADTLRIAKRRTQGSGMQTPTSEALKGYQMGHRMGHESRPDASNQESGTRDQGSGISEQQQERTRLTPLTPAADNVRVITRLVRDLQQQHPDAGFADLKDLAKDACARHRIAYDAEVVGKAVDSALAMGAAH